MFVLLAPIPNLNQTQISRQYIFCVLQQFVGFYRVGFSETKQN